MKCLAVIAGAVFMAAPLTAQGPTPLALSLQEALTRADAASPAVGIARAGATSAAADRMRARSALLPQLSGSMTYTRTLASEFSGLVSSPANDSFPTPTNCGHFHPNPNLPIGVRLDSLERGLDCAANSSPFDFSKSPFGQKNTWNFGLSGTQTLFDPKISGQLATARAGQERADVELTSQRTQAMLDVAQAYLDVQLAERLLDIADSTLAQAQRTFEQTRLERQVGNAAEFDQLRATVARDNLNPVVILRRAQRDQALLRLRQLLDLPAATPLLLATPLGDTAAAIPPPLAPQLAVIPDTSVARRAPVREAQASLRASDGQVSAARAARLPTLNLSSTYAKIDFPSKVFSFDNFLTDWSVNVRLDVPIYSGGRTRANTLTAEAAREQSAMRVKQAEQQAQRDVQDVTLLLASAQSVWDAVRGTVALAVRAYAIAELRYRTGLSTLTELGDARNQLGQAEANRAQAAHDFQIARIRVVLLRDLPFGAPIVMPSASATAVPGNQ
ncbi:MAG: TolC family protein [Gemmatimonadales bacterium]